jgi:hypothetical protein
MTMRISRREISSSNGTAETESGPLSGGLSTLADISD